jgi:PAS domain S-box-containing protein
MPFRKTKPLKVLVVDDDLVDRKSLRRLLSQSSLTAFTVEEADSLKGAFGLLDKERFDVVLLDLNLPDSKGENTLLSVNEKHPEVAAVVITGECGEEYGLKAIAQGAQEYLTKGRFDKHALTKSLYYAVERKNLECKLQLAKEVYAIFENSAVGITMADMQERLISWNRFTESLLGMGKEDLYLRPVESLYPPSEWEKMKALNVRQKGMQHHFETQIIRKNDEVIDVDISLSVMKNPAGKPIGSVGLITDITERKRLHEILDRKQKNLTAIFDAAPVGMLLIDDSLLVRRVNQTISQMLGKDYSEIINRRLGDALGCVETTCRDKVGGCGTAEPTCLLVKAIQQVFDTGQPVRKAEIQHALRLDGAEGQPWLSISAEPVTIDGYQRVVIAVDNITERKQAEEKLRETMELKSQFVSTVSHELRTPLTCMKEAIGVILDGAAGKVNDKQKEFLNIAQRNIDRLAALVNDVLDFQKLEAGRMKFDVHENDVVEVVEHVRRMMDPIAEKKDVSFSVEIDDQLPAARFDSNKVIQVLTNLVSNAIKFTPADGRVCVRIRTQGDELVIGVTDTGVGIPAEALPKIFERFYRVHRPGQEIPGTGLGLAIVEQIITAHGGRIEVESEEGKGTTFTIFLPVNSSCQQESPAAEADLNLEDDLLIESQASEESS